MREIWVDKNKCLHCLSCQLNCTLAHSRYSNLWNAIKETPASKPRLYTVRDDDRPFLLMCRHCENSPCLKACIAAAITRDTESGIIKIEEDMCVGCGMCIMVCPFGVIGRDRERRVSLKCDRCPDRDKPACVEACPTGALVLSSGDAHGDAKRKDYISRLLGAEGGVRQ